MGSVCHHFFNIPKPRIWQSHPLYTVTGQVSLFSFFTQLPPSTSVFTNECSTTNHSLHILSVALSVNIGLPFPTPDFLRIKNSCSVLQGQSPWYEILPLNKTCVAQPGMFSADSLISHTLTLSHQAFEKGFSDCSHFFGAPHLDSLSQLLFSAAWQMIQVFFLQ